MLHHMLRADAQKKMKFVSTASATLATAAQTITVNIPSGTASGDIMIAAFTGGSSATPTTPSGWTVIGNIADTAAASRLVVYGIVVAGAPPSTLVYDWGNTYGAGTIVTYRGGSSAIGTGATQYNSADSTSLVAPSVTAPNNGVLLCVFSTDDTNTSITAPGSMTQIASAFGSSPANRGHIICAQDVSSGSTGTRTATYPGAADSSKTVSVVVY